jgi:DNA polymerase family A
VFGVIKISRHYRIQLVRMFCTYSFMVRGLNCYRALRWQLPQRVLDLYAEFRCLTNGLSRPAGSGLLGALAYYGIDAGGASAKKEMQTALGDGSWRDRYTPEEVLDYCQKDVDALERLFMVLAPKLDLPRALLRGRFMPACSQIEWNGVPINTETLGLLREHWTDIQDALITEIDKGFGVFEGRSFRRDRFARLLAHMRTPWPLSESGQLDLSEEAFRQQAKAFPWVAPLHELRVTLSGLRLESLAVGADQRNRVLISPYGARTSRNTPSNSQFVFGPATWIRSLIRPPENYGIAYIDWKAQEVGIAAKLSNDHALMAGYLSGDVYLHFGRQAGLVPTTATKETHKTERALFKQCFLATGYGQGEFGLAQRIGQPLIVARDLLRAHRRTYHKFWAWSDAAVDHALLRGATHTIFGWQLRLGENPNVRSLRNFVVQGNAAEMMRIAAALATERGLPVCAVVHDAFMICSPLARLEDDITAMRAAMAEASRIVLDGFELETDVADDSIVRWPDGYMDPRGQAMWAKVVELLQRAIVRRRAA